MSEGADDDPVAREMEIQLSKGSLASGADVAFDTAVLRRGARRWRTARLMRIYDDTGRVRGRELRLETWDVSSRRAPFAEPRPSNTWRCEDEEIELLTEFLRACVFDRRAGRFRLVQADGDVAELLETLGQNSVQVSSAVSLLEQCTNAPSLAEAIARSDLASVVMQTLEIERRQAQLNALRDVVRDPSKNEHDLHRVLKGQSWIFGGRYVGKGVRRQLTTQSSLDIPLLRGDGSLHVVEIKQASIPNLIEEQRAAGPVVGSDVNKSVGQVQNYLRDLDENRAQIKVNFGIDCRRSSASLVIGNSEAVRGFTSDQVKETLRTYNSFLSRIEVLTYDELLDSARRALSFWRQYSGGEV